MLDQIDLQDFHEIADYTAERIFNSLKDVTLWNIKLIKPLIVANMNVALSDILNRCSSTLNKEKDKCYSIIKNPNSKGKEIRMARQKIANIKISKKKIKHVLNTISEYNDYTCLRNWLKEQYGDKTLQKFDSDLVSKNKKNN